MFLEMRLYCYYFNQLHLDIQVCYNNPPFTGAQTSDVMQVIWVVLSLQSQLSALHLRTLLTTERGNFFLPPRKNFSPPNNF